MKRILKSKKRLVFVLVALLVVAIIIVNAGFALLMNFSVFKTNGAESFEKYIYGSVVQEDFEWFENKTENISTTNSEGKEINAVKVTNQHISHSYVIMCHQYGGSPKTMGAYAKHFYELGFNLVLPEMRGHGQSAYKINSLGWQDSNDIKDWIAAIIESDEQARIVLFGVSTGACAVTLTAADELPKNVRLAIVDSCYTSLEDVTREYIKNQTPFSAGLTAGFVSLFAKNKLGAALSEADVIPQLQEIELPIMFINGENDAAVPAVLSKKLYENCDAEGVEEVIIEGGTHGANLKADPQAYWSAIDAFILNNLGI